MRYEFSVVIAVDTSQFRMFYAHIWIPCIEEIGFVYGLD